MSNLYERYDVKCVNCCLEFKQNVIQGVTFYCSCYIFQLTYAQVCQNWTHCRKKHKTSPLFWVLKWGDLVLMQNSKAQQAALFISHSISILTKEINISKQMFHDKTVHASHEMMTCGWNIIFPSQTIEEWKKWVMADLIWIRVYKILALGLFSAECRLLWTLQSTQLKLGSLSIAERKRKLLVCVQYKCISVCLLMEQHFIFSLNKC